MLEKHEAAKLALDFHRKQSGFHSIYDLDMDVPKEFDFIYNLLLKRTLDEIKQTATTGDFSTVINPGFYSDVIKDGRFILNEQLLMNIMWKQLIVIGYDVVPEYSKDGHVKLKVSWLPY